MNILICSFEYPPHGSGIANVAFNLRNHFVARGHKVDVCSPDGPEIRKGHWGLIEHLGGIGILQYWYKTGKFLKEHMDDYDAVLLENPMLLHRLYSKNLCITTHTTYREFWDMFKEHGTVGAKAYYWTMMMVEKWCFRRLDKRIKYTSASDDVTEVLVKLGIRKNKVIYISNGADINRFKPATDKKKKDLKKKYGIDPSKEAILFVGRLEWQHRPIELLNIYNNVRKKNESIQLVMVGSGSYGAKIKRHVAMHGIKDVIFIPRIDYKNLHEIYQASEYFILHSLYTGQSLAMLEAFATGCLMLVPDITAFKRLLHDSKTGCLYHPTSEKKASEQILRYLGKVDQAKEMRQQRAFAEKKVDWEINEYLKYLKKRNG